MRTPCVAFWLGAAQCLLWKSAECLPRHSRFQVSRSGEIELVHNPELRLNVHGGAMAEGDPLVLWPCAAREHELFNITDSVISLRVNYLWCLNAEGGAHAGARIITWPCSHQGRVEPHEDFVHDDDGRIRLRRHPELCIHVKDGLVERDAQLILWRCGSRPEHEEDIFVFQDGLIQLAANKEYHLSAPGGEVAESVPIILGSCEASSHELFEFTYPDNRIRLKHKPEMCLNAEGGLGPGNRIIIWPCASQPEVNERFIYDKQLQVISPQAVKTLAFNVRGGNMQNGGEIILWTIDEPEVEEL